MFYKLTIKTMKVASILIDIIWWYEIYKEWNWYRFVRVWMTQGAWFSTIHGGLMFYNLLGL